jgi:hypothetical protein
MALRLERALRKLSNGLTNDMKVPEVSLVTVKSNLIE